MFDISVNKIIVLIRNSFKPVEFSTYRVYIYIYIYISLSFQFLRIKKITSYIHLLTRHVEKFSDFITITIQFHKITHCNAKHAVVRGLNRVYIHNQMFKEMLFL
jgi:hypothetical protein